MTFKFLQTSAILGALIGLTACASGPEKRGPERGEHGEEGERKRRPTASPAVASYPIGLVFASMDSSGDGVTTREELSSGTAKHWTNFGGQTRLSAVRFSEWSLRELGSIDAMPNFLAFDRDFSSTVSQEEFESRLADEFRRLDKDSNSRLTREEVIFTIATQSGRGGGRGEGSEGGRGQGGGGGRGGRGGGRGGGGGGR